MGKGSNVQKAQMARERNQRNIGKTDEERKAASVKAKLDAMAFVCGICKQSFMVNARPPSTLYLHVTAKHDGVDPKDCFPSLAGYDPNDPFGEKKAAQEKAAAEARAQRASARKASIGGRDLDLLSVGITKMKKSAKF
jgi:Zinc-binding